MNNTQTQLAHQIAEAANTLIVSAKPVTVKAETVIAKIQRLHANATEQGKNGLQTSAVRGGLPLAVVNYNSKRLGVFWIGTGGKTEKPTVGLRKLVNSGRLHRGHRRFAPAYWVEISDLAAHGNS